jgi:hypothetical protein
LNLEKLVLPLEVNGAAFNTGIKAAVAGATALVAAMGVAIKATFDWAQELDSITDVLDVTDTTAAALNFTLRKSGVATEVATKAFVILNKGLVDAKGKLDATGKALKEWGINVFDANGVLKDQTTLINDVAQKYGELGTQQEKVNFLTEVFGRSGAELVDFFDTLAADGGIDAVTKKVEALGLAIDPNRYEKFNRNLEELKMIGLALAVGFTEKVMPALEKFLGWFTKFASNPSVAGFAKGIDAIVGGAIQGMADKIHLWVGSGGPQELSDSIVSWIENIGTGGEVESKALTAAQNLVEALARAFTSIDWASIDAALDVWDAKILETFDVWDAQILATFDEWDAAILAKLDEWDAATLAKFDEWNVAVNTSISAGLTQVDQSFANWSISTWGKVVAWAASVDQAFANWSIRTMGAIKAWAATTIGQIVAWGASLIATISAALTAFAIFCENKLRDVSKAFFNAGVRWASQAAAGFLNNMATIAGAVQRIVDEVNKILKKIQTSFSFSFNWGSGPTPPGNNPPGGGGGGGGGGGCFVAGTLVTMADGSLVRIEDVKAGDIVLSWHNGEMIPAEVEKPLHHPKEDAPALIVLNGRLVGTPEHLIYTDGDWLPLGFLKVGDAIQIDGKPAKVETLQRKYGFVPVYNLETKHESHNYIANGVLVHNAKNTMNAAGGSFMIPQSAGWEGFNLGNMGTVSGGEAIRITPRGQNETMELGSSTIAELVSALAPAIAQATIKASQSV